MKLSEWNQQYDIVALEKSVVGTVLVHPDLYRTTAKHLKPAHFFLLAHTQIWDAMARILDNGLQIDTVSVCEYSKHDGYDYDENHVYDLLREVSNVENIPYYAATIIEFYHRRNAGQAMHTALSEIGNADKPLVDIIAGVEQTFNDVRAARTPSKTSYDRLHEHMDAVEQRQEHDGYLGLRTGIAELDALYQGQIEPGTLNTLAARPGTGKSASAGRLMINMAQSGLKVGNFSMELSEAATYNRYASQYTGIPMQFIRSGMMSEKQYRYYVAKMKDFTGITNNLYESYERNLTSDDIRNQMYAWHAQDGLDVVFIDYLQLILTPPRYRDIRHDLQIGNITRDLRATAGELGLPIIALAQLNRAVENRNSPKPTLSDLAQSGRIEQDSDTVSFLYWPDENHNKICWYLAKSRNGKFGTVTLEFRGETVDIIGTPPKIPRPQQTSFSERSVASHD